jgi:hypothetical protein
MPRKQLRVPPEPQSRDSVDLTKQLRDEIGSQGSLVSTVKDLLVRVGEPDPTREARMRVERILAEHGIQTTPLLTAMFLRPGAKVRLTLGPIPAREGPGVDRVNDETDNRSPIAKALAASREAGYKSDLDADIKLVTFVFVLLGETWRRMRPNCHRAPRND